MKILLTGATGLLGRQIMIKGEEHGHQMLGTGFKRAGFGSTHKMDLTDFSAVEASVNEIKPECIIHCAAERRPDVCANQHEHSRVINVESTALLAEISKKMGIPILYMSTDYVFSGFHPPYKPEDETKPLNDYGKFKQSGEWFLLDNNPDALILRVPILYGPTGNLLESSVTIMTNKMLTENKMKADNWAVRYPTWTPDTAEVVIQLLEKNAEDKTVKGVFHYSGEEAFTKYEMMKVMACILNMMEKEISPVNNPLMEVPRPHNAHLDCSRLISMGINPQTAFKEGLQNVFMNIGFCHRNFGCEEK